MILNRNALTGIYTNFLALFNKAFEDATSKWDKVATRVPSSTGEESYKWLGSMPKMREWVGERVIKNLAAHDYTIKNKDFEVTVAVSKNDIADDKLGIYAPVLQEMGNSAATFPDDLVFPLLHGGFENLCYDGLPFFDASHKVGRKTISNKGTAKLTAIEYGKARAIIMSYKNEEDKSLNLMPNLLVVPPALEAVALEILKADQVNGTTNIYKGTAELLVVPELSGNDTEWFLLCTGRPLKPLIYQEREIPKLVSRVSDSDDNVFFNKEFIYGADARGNAGYGFWQMAYGSTGTAK